MPAAFAEHCHRTPARSFTTMPWPAPRGQTETGVVTKKTCRQTGAAGGRSIRPSIRKGFPRATNLLGNFLGVGPAGRYARAIPAFTWTRFPAWTPKGRCDPTETSPKGTARQKADFTQGRRQNQQILKAASDAKNGQPSGTGGQKRRSREMRSACSALGKQKVLAFPLSPAKSAQGKAKRCWEGGRTFLPALLRRVYHGTGRGRALMVCS